MVLVGSFMAGVGTQGELRVSLMCLSPARVDTVGC
jgi:hypothetical protein